MQKILPFILALICAPVYCATLQGLWSGSFNSANIAGGIEIQFVAADSRWTADVKVQPNGRLSNFPVDNLQVHGHDVSFDVQIYDGRRLRFNGQAEPGRLHGRAELLSGPTTEQGDWSAIKLVESTATGTLPAPSGHFSTGRTSFEWTDPDRMVMEVPLQKLKRELLVHIWYPSDKSHECSRAPYLPDLALIPTPVWPQAALTIPKVQTHSCLGAPLSNEQKSTIPL